jgi:hypothetical protein
MEPNSSAKSRGVKLLDNFIDANFREVALSGRVSSWLANQEEPTVADRSGELRQATPVPQSATKP